MADYKLVNDPITNTQNSMILRLADNAWIPISEDNRDYQRYLEWLAEGNEPLPADEPTV